MLGNFRNKSHRSMSYYKEKGAIRYSFHKIQLLQIQNSFFCQMSLASHFFFLENILWREWMSGSQFEFVLAKGQKSFNNSHLLCMEVSLEILSLIAVLLRVSNRYQEGAAFTFHRQKWIQYFTTVSLLVLLACYKKKLKH